MKRCWLSLLLGAVLVFPSILYSQRVYLKPVLGVTLGGKVFDSWNSTTESFDLSVAAGKKSGPALDTSLELVFQLVPSLSFSLGVGYIYNMEGIYGSEGQISPPEASGIVDFSYNPWLSMPVYPLCFTAIYSLPIKVEARLTFLVGVGYYIGKITCLDGNYFYKTLDSLSNWSRRDWEFKSETSAIGYHAGAGVEIDIDLGMTFFAEVLYRKADFKEFETTATTADMLEEGAGVLEGGSTFFYAKGINGGEALGDIDYSVSRISLSGLVFRVGLKFLFGSKRFI
jgi:opacity protein-like surface antigen